MYEIQAGSLEKILKGRILAGPTDSVLTQAVIDSREAGPHAVFFALRGDNRDGHDFIKNVLRAGAGAVVSEKSPEELGISAQELTDSGTTFVRVRSTMHALRRLAAYNREVSGVPIIAVTGSSGKTTTKDMMASVLAQKYNVLKTEGNLNNEYGIPRTILSIGPEHQIAIIEMGMDHLHDIDQSIGFVKPQAAVITNIGSVHLETLGSKENILKAKSEILETLGDQETALLNGDDPYLDRIDQGPFRIRRFGLDSEGLDIKARDCVCDADGVHFTVDEDNYSLKLPGRHLIYDALPAIWAGKCFGLGQDAIQAGLNAYSPSEHRMAITKKDGITYIDDSYNANPDSVKAALSSLEALGAGARTVAVLGDMYELGEEEINGHLEVGREAARRVDYLIGVGEASRNIIRGALSVRAGMQGSYFKTTEEAAVFLIDFLEGGDTVLFKASHGMHFDNLLDLLLGD